MNKIFKYGWACMTFMAATFALTACSDDDDVSDLTSAIYPTSVELVLPSGLDDITYEDATGTTTLPLLKGETVSLGYEISPSNVTYDEVEWYSSDESVATVDDNGLVTAVSGDGQGYSVIQVSPTPFYSGSGIYSTIKVTVSNELEPATAITISAANDVTEFYAGETLQLSVDIEPDDATYHTVSWSSSDESIATVSTRGLVTGVGAGDVTITATAIDGSGVTATIDLTILMNVDPEEVDIDQTYAYSNGYLCAFNEKTLTLDYTTVPEVCTTSFIEWTSSDESIATVENGVVTYNQDGNFGQVTITATCPATGNSSSIDLYLAAGLLRELFHDENNITWKDAGQSGNGTSTSTEWHYGYITITTYTQNSTKQRADIKCQMATTYIHAGNYPIVAIRMDDLMDQYESVTARNINLDTSGTFDDTKYSGNVGGSNNKYAHNYYCSDGSRVFIYDLSTQQFPTGGLAPTTSLGAFTTFQIKHADIATLTEQVTFNVYWVQTFAQLSDVADYLESEGLTYEEE